MEIYNNCNTTQESFNFVDTIDLSVDSLLNAIHLGIQNELPSYSVCPLLILLIQKDNQSASNLLISIPETTSMILYRSILKCGVSFHISKDKVGELIESIPLSKLEQILSSNAPILLWIYSQMIDYNYQIISPKVSSLKKSKFLNYKFSINTPFDKFIIKCIYDIQFKEMVHLFDEGKFTACLLKSSSFLNVALGNDVPFIQQWLILNSNILDMVTIAFKCFILQKFDYQKFSFWMMLTRVFSKSKPNDLMSTLLRQIDNELLGLVSKLCSNIIIPINQTLYETLLNLFSRNSINIVTDSILQLNLVKISFKFVSIKIKTIERLMDLSPSINILETILNFKSKKLLLVDIDEVSQSLTFNHSFKSSSLGDSLRNEIFNDLNQIDSSYLNKLI